MGIRRRLNIPGRRPKPIPKTSEKKEEPKPDYKAMFEARTGFWNGNVKIDFHHRDPPIKGHCTNCGRQLVDYDMMYYDGEISLCWDCFDLFEKFTPVLVHHYPGCVENGGEFDIHVWRGYDEFLEKHPPSKGWHYELSRTHIMDVTDDGKEWWVLWNARDDLIVRELRERIPEWHPH